jgi:hypothetical protein
LARLWSSLLLSFVPLLCLSFPHPPSHTGSAKLLPCPTCSYILTHFFSHSLLITLMMEVVSTYETSVNFYQTTWCNIREASHCHTCCHKNLKSHQVNHISNNIIVSKTIWWLHY